MSDYTPTTNEVRSSYLFADPVVIRDTWEGRAKEFDRWLAKVRADAWHEGFEAGLREAHEQEGAGA